MEAFEAISAFQMEATFFFALFIKQKNGLINEKKIAENLFLVIN